MTPKTAFVFPGQGSQSVGMLENMAALYPIVQQTLEEASEAVGYDIGALCATGPAEKLNQSEFTQVALLSASVAIWRLWCAKQKDLGKSLPRVLAGHSLGEYSALVCAEALSLTEAAPLVGLRGRLMQEAVPEGQGAMAAILGLDKKTVLAICEETANLREIVAAANYNAPGQVVISGHTVAVERAISQAKARGAKRAILLAVSVPSHCVLMKAAAPQLRQALNIIQIQPPKIPVIHNVDVKTHREPQEIRQALIEQLYQPVRWVETVEKMAVDGIRTLLECGPGTVLSSLNKRIVPELRSESLLLSISNGEALCPA